MGVKVLALNKRCHVAFPAAPRRACTVYGAKRTSAIVAFGDLVLIPGTLTVHCEAVNRGAMYDVGDGEFIWRSKDQVCKAVNAGPFGSKPTGDFLATSWVGAECALGVAQWDIIEFVTSLDFEIGDWVLIFHNAEHYMIGYITSFPYPKTMMINAQHVVGPTVWPVGFIYWTITLVVRPVAPLVSNGGVGTVIAPVMTDEESPTNIYIRDEEI